jgi:nitrate/TMAO reductase-like tetraheme cytochrome c subunit
MYSKNTFLSASFFTTSIAFFFVTFFAVNTVSAEDVANSCIECHNQPLFRITNIKIYKYFRDWDLSIHAQEGVTCFDCHGGNPEETDRKKAHGKDIKQLLIPVKYERISATCGKCHKKNVENYKKTKHYKILMEKGSLYPTPNCITCHGSINTSIPKSDTIADICTTCHNVVTENRPEIPKLASYLIERLSFINYYSRYLISKGVFEKSPDFSTTIDKEFSELAQIWHTLELVRIEEKTLHIRTIMMKKGKELRQAE